MAIFLKDPGALVDYAVDWSAGYLAGATIAESTWAIEPGGSGAVSVAETRVDGGRAIAILSGGQSGIVYHVTNRVTFSDSSSDERVLVLRVEDR